MTGENTVLSTAYSKGPLVPALAAAYGQLERPGSRCEAWWWYCGVVALLVALAAEHGGDGRSAGRHAGLGTSQVPSAIRRRHAW